MLTLPIGQTGQLHAYRHSERPWTRFHIGRGRILAHQLETVLERHANTPTLWNKTGLAHGPTASNPQPSRPRRDSKSTGTRG